MPPPFKKSSTSALTAKSISLNGDLPVTALPAAGGAMVALDNFGTESNIKLPVDCRWVLFSSNVDFLVNFRNSTTPGSWPGAITSLATVGNPNPPDPDNMFGPGDPGSYLIELNPGLREVTGYTEISIMGLGAGFLTAMFYSE